MFSKTRVISGFFSLLITYSLLFNVVIQVQAQSDIVLSRRIGGGSSIFVSRVSRKAKKRINAPRRKSRVKRTKKQRRVTRRKIVRQSRRVAKKNRKRRSIKIVTPKEFKEVKVEELTRQSKEKASKVIAGAGEYYVDRDEFEKAVGFLEQAVELDSNNKDAKHALSETYTTLADQVGDQAEEYAKLAAKALAENKPDEVKNYLTKERFATQRIEKDLLRAIELNDENSSAYASLGQYYDDKNEDDKAKENFEKALSIDPELTNVKAPLGIIYYQNGEVAKAEELINAALNAGEDNAEIQYFIGLIKYKKDDNLGAKAALEKSILMDNENAEAHYYLGATLTRLNQADRAILEFITTTNLDPKFVNAWFDLGVAYYNRKKYEQAEEAFNNAIKLNINQTDEERRIYAESHANLAETYRQMGRYDLALGKYRNAVDLLNDDELYSTYGFALIQEEKWIDAIKAFEKVTELNGDSLSFANLGWAHYQVSQHHKSWNRKTEQRESLLKSKAALQTSISKDSNLEAGYINLGNTLIDLEEYQEAINTLERAKTLRKDWVLIEYTLGDAYLKNGDYKTAIKYLKNAIKLDKKNSEALYDLGVAELKSGNRKASEKTLGKLRKLDTKRATELERVIKMDIFNNN